MHRLRILFTSLVEWVHSFQNTGKVDAKFVLVVTPAGLENFFRSVLSRGGWFGAAACQRSAGGTAHRGLPEAWSAACSTEIRVGW
jgi:hypothetical protein